MSLNRRISIDASWTLFLDRDGVINQRIPGDYVRNWAAFQWCEGSLETIVQLSHHFGRIIVVTNQQGIGKGLVSAKAVEAIHDQLCETVLAKGGRVDRVYYCPSLAAENAPCRKPNSGMGHQAKADFPVIDFERSIMVGDSISDMEFAFRLGMKSVLVSGKTEEIIKNQSLKVDFRLTQLRDLENCLNL